MGSRRPAAMPDSVSYGPEPGFLYSDGMSGGTGFFFVNPCDVYPSRPGRRAKARKAALVSIYRRIPDTS